MNIMKVEWLDVINGEGLRLSIFTSGCRIHCKGCFNKSSWDFNAGKPFTNEIKEKIFETISDENKGYSGISLLGGEPSEHALELISFLDEFKKRCPNKNVWIWSGWDKDNLINIPNAIELLKRCDVLVAGPFIESKKDLSLKFRGSTNQIVYDIIHNDEKIEFKERRI